jgi:hypothetical protein
VLLGKSVKTLLFHLYEVVVKLPAFKRKTLVLLGKSIKTLLYHLYEGIVKLPAFKRITLMVLGNSVKIFFHLFEVDVNFAKLLLFNYEEF